MDRLVTDGVVNNHDEISRISEDTEKRVPHKCNHIYLVRIGGGQFRCRKLNDLYVRPDNTRHVTKPFPSNIYPSSIK